MRHPRWRQARAVRGHRHEEGAARSRRGDASSREGTTTWVGASKVRVATRPRQGHCCARLRGTKRTPGLKALPAPGVEKTERGGGAGERAKGGSAHARPQPTSCAAADRVSTSAGLGPSATAPSVGLVVPSGQALHLAFKRRNYKRSPSSVQERPTQPGKPIRNVADGANCAAFGVLDSSPLSEHAHLQLEKKKKPRLLGNCL